MYISRLTPLTHRLINCSLNDKFREEGTCTASWVALASYHVAVESKGENDTKAYAHDIMSTILVFQNNETVAMLVYQTSPVGVETFSYVNTKKHFVPINLHTCSCWTNECTLCIHSVNIATMVVKLFSNTLFLNFNCKLFLFTVLYKNYG